MARVLNAFFTGMGYDIARRVDHCNLSDFGMRDRLFQGFERALCAQPRSHELKFNNAIANV